jgi:hypothetical protein
MTGPSTVRHTIIPLVVLTLSAVLSLAGEPRAQAALWPPCWTPCRQTH